MRPQRDRGKIPGLAPNANTDTDSSIVSLTSSTHSRRDEENKPKPEDKKDALKDSNSMLSTDLYPTRDTEAEKVSSF